ncbi:MAG: serine/threonine protein kinase [Acidobacteria bacterium]|nr:serine/threonine protein kinase [Acidobacteriota bacterium]
MFQSNQEIGIYTLIRKIGRGGFGEVWLAQRRTELLTTQVAVKLPHREQVDLEAIRREAALWAQASGHTNILPIIEANIYDGQIVIVSEYAPDGSLEEMLRREISLKQTLETAIGILNGLEFLHARQIIHRDIKPANILLQGETPRLADFGISRIIKTTALSTSIIGTPKYMSPEAFDGKRTAQTDIWSVGVILYQMLSGRVPFPQEISTELMFAIVMKEPDPMPESIPPDLRRIVRKALAKLPENRFDTAREMREELQRVLIDISRPTLAPTIAFDGNSSKPEDIEDKSVVTEIPKTFLIDRETAADKTVVRPNASEPPVAVENKSLPATVASKIPQFEQTVPPFLLSIREDTEENVSKPLFHRIFYLLAPLIGLGLGYFIQNLTVKFIGNNFADSKILFGYYLTNAFFLMIPILFFWFGLAGGLLGYVYPREKWRWGLWLNALNLVYFLMIWKEIPPYGTNYLTLNRLLAIILITVPAVSCAASFLGSRLGRPGKRL